VVDGVVAGSLLVGVDVVSVVVGAVVDGVEVSGTVLLADSELLAVLPVGVSLLTEVSDAGVEADGVVDGDTAQTVPTIPWISIKPSTKASCNPRSSSIFSAFKSRRALPRSISHWPTKVTGPMASSGMSSVATTA